MNPLMQHVFLPGGGSASTLLLLHEAGGDENALIPVGRGVAPALALLSPRGPTVHAGEFRFYDEADAEVQIPRQAAALETFVRDAAERYGVDPTRITGLGYSDGATMMAAILILYPKLLSGAVLLRPGMPELAGALLPVAGTPVLILAGQHDVVIPAQATEKLAQTLSYAGAKVEVRWSNLGHELAPEDFNAARDFFKNLS